MRRTFIPGQTVGSRPISNYCTTSTLLPPFHLCQASVGIHSGHCIENSANTGNDETSVERVLCSNHNLHEVTRGIFIQTRQTLTVHHKGGAATYSVVSFIQLPISSSRNLLGHRLSGHTGSSRFIRLLLPRGSGGRRL